jgi:transposase
LHLKLQLRKKGSKLSELEREYLEKMLRSNWMYVRIIIELYNLSYSICKRLMRYRKEEKNFGRLLIDKSSNCSRLNTLGQKVIRKIIQAPSRPLTIRSIQETLRKGWRKNIKPRTIKRFIKEECKYSYKRGSVRPTKFNSKKSIMTRGIYWTRLLSDIYSKSLVVNIDECSFARSCKRNYSWLSVGKSSSILNDGPKGKWNLIWGVMSNGEWIGMLKTKTVNSTDLSIFLMIMEELLRSAMINIEEDVVIHADNAKIHQSKVTKAVAMHIKAKFIFLSPYSPQFAPVELMFGIIKSKLRSKISTEEINFGKKEGMEAIVGIMEDILKDSICRIWYKIVREAKLGVRQALQESK